MLPQLLAITEQSPFWSLPETCGHLLSRNKPTQKNATTMILSCIFYWWLDYLVIKSAVQLGRSSIFTPPAKGVLVHFPVPFKHLVETGTVRVKCLVQSRTQHPMTHTTQSGSARLTIRQSRPSDTLLYAMWSKVLFYNIRKGFRQGNCIFYKAFFEEFEIFCYHGI